MSQASLELGVHVRQTDSRRALTAGHNDCATVPQHLRYLEIIL